MLVSPIFEIKEGDMKAIKSLYLGVQPIKSKGIENQLFEVRNIMHAHRSKLVQRMLEDLPRYLYGRFERSLDMIELAELKRELLRYSRESIDLSIYSSFLEKFRKNQVTQLTNQEFLDEIDARIRWSMSNRQLRIAS